MAYPVIMHVNYCEQGQSVEEICRKAAKWGFDGVEFRRRRSGVEETRDDYLDALAKGLEAVGLKHVLFGAPGPDLSKEDAGEREREVADVVDFYRLVAERFGVTTVNLLTGNIRNPDPSIGYFERTQHGSFVATDEQWQWQIEGCQALADGLKGVDVRFGFETHPVYLHDTIQATKKLIDAIDRPSIGANLDYGNMLGFDDRPSLEESIRIFGDKLHYIHLKNSASVRGGAFRISTALGEGQINNREFMMRLMDVGYRGPICIEAPRAGDREWFAQQDLAYIKSVLADLDG